MRYHFTTTTPTTPWLYSPCRTLASFTTIFQSSLLCARILQFVTPILLRSSLTSSIYLDLSLPTLLLPSGVFWYNIFTTLSSLILFTCPSHLNLPFFLFLLLCPTLHLIASLLHLFCSSSILLHILDQIFFSATSFPKYAKFSHHLPLSTMHHASEPHSTTGLIIVSYILIFVVLDTAFDNFTIITDIFFTQNSRTQHTKQEKTGFIKNINRTLWTLQTGALPPPNITGVCHLKVKKKNVFVKGFPTIFTTHLTILTFSHNHSIFQYGLIMESEHRLTAW